MKKVYLIAVVFALIAGFATYMFAKQIDEKSTYKDADTVSVVFAVQDIPKNTKITQEMLDDEENPYFEVKPVVVDSVVPNYATDKNELLENITVDPIYAGEQINKSRFESVDGEDVALSFKLAPGKVAYSFTAGSVTGVDGYISEGDTVNVIVYDTEDGKTTTKVAYKNLKIIRVSTNSVSTSSSASGTKITEYGTLTVEVTEKQALKLYEIENDYTYKLVLNPRK